MINHLYYENLVGDLWHNTFRWRILKTGLPSIYGHAKTSTLCVFGFSGVEWPLGRTLAGLIGRQWINTGETRQRNETQHLNQSMLAFKINTLAGKSILVRNPAHVKVSFVLTWKVCENNQTQLRELGKGLGEPVLERYGWLNRKPRAATNLGCRSSCKASEKPVPAFQINTTFQIANSVLAMAVSQNAA